MSYARSLAKLSAFQIRAGADTIPYGVENIPYQTGASNGTTVKRALDWLFAVVYPNTKDAVDTFGDLPSTGNTLRDYRIVLDDGDGKAAGYRWEQREGDIAPVWYKVHDMDWSNDTILANFIDQTIELYVSKYGRQDIDVNGNPVTGIFEGQSIYGGATSGNLTLNANAGDASANPEDQTGYIQLNGQSRPAYDASYDLGTATERFRNAFFSGDLSDATNVTNIAEMAAAYMHSLVTSGNPHDVSYDELTTQLGTLTLDGDVSGSADLSASGDKTITVTVNDNSHTHDASTTITGFDSEVYAYLKSALVDTSEVTWIFDDGLETITADIALDSDAISDIANPVVDTILAGSLASDGWEAIAATVELTGDVVGTASFSTTGGGWSIATTASSSTLSTMTDIDLTNKVFTSTSGTPTTVTATAHGLITGEKAVFYGGELSGEQVITKIDANSFTVPATTSGADSGHYIPQGAQLLFDTASSVFKIAKEYEEIRLGELSGLDEDVLDIYVAKDGRSSGQTINGGISASENLILESTTNATKGTIQAKSNIIPFATATYSGGWSGTNLGSATNKWNNLYMSGEAFGLRIENVGSLPAASGTNTGRLIFFDGDIYVNTGGAWVKVGTGAAGGGATVVTTVTAPYTVDLTDDVVLVDNSTYGFSLTITLPPASSVAKILRIKSIGTATDDIIIQGDGAETIDGSNTFYIYRQYDSLTIVSNGTNWSIL